MITSIFWWGISNKKCASINSRPLFIIVAESTEIFFPIDQLGCFTACSGVISTRSLVSLFKKGPPDAVKINFETFERFFESNTWKIALCSESTGRIIEPFCLAIDVINDPEQTRLSLLANAIGMPFFTALTTGINPVDPVIAATTMTGG